MDRRVERVKRGWGREGGGGSVVVLGVCTNVFQ